MGIKSQPKAKIKKLDVPPKKKKAPNAESEFVKNIGALQPPVFDTLKPVLGVTLIDGSRSKASTDKKSDRKLLTREEYLRQTDKFAGPPKISISNAQSPEPNMTTTIEEERTQTIQEEDSQIQSVNLELLDDIPNIEDELINSIRRNSNAGSAKENRFVSGDGNRISMYTAGFPEEEDMSEIDKFNKKILMSTDWGINPPAMKEKAEPKTFRKPNSRQQRKTHGSKPKLPRDRPYVDQATHRTHDPPPRYGKTMRHVD